MSGKKTKNIETKLKLIYYKDGGLNFPTINKKFNTYYKGGFVKEENLLIDSFRGTQEVCYGVYIPCQDPLSLVVKYLDNHRALTSIDITSMHSLMNIVCHDIKKYINSKIFKKIYIDINTFNPIIKDIAINYLKQLEFKPILKKKTVLYYLEIGEKETQGN